MQIRDPLLRRRGVELVLISFAVLFQELTLIRWLGSQIRVLAYFPNVVLMGAFLGLGIGCLRAKRASLLWIWPASLLITVAAGWAMSRIAFTQESVSEHLWLLYYDMKSAPIVHGVRLPIVATFILCGLCFIAPGQLVAQRLSVFGDRGRSASLWGYSFDLLGSLFGVIAFAAASFLRTFPVIWFGLLLLIAGTCFVLVRPRRASVVFYICFSAVILLIVNAAETAERFSPYYALRTVVLPNGGTGMAILANGSLHQYAAPVARRDLLNSDYDLRIREGYHTTYRRIGRPVRRVLVLGAGSGNDVATALDEGVQHVDAVEIDPVILDLGRNRHPDRPYSSPLVRVFNTDARSFLNQTDEKYDLIVFGTLDSMTRLSAMSSVRLDNFVYTEDCIIAAKRHLSADGGIAMYFMVSAEFIHDRLRGMLTAAFGQQPVVQNANYNLFNVVLMAGPGFERLRAAAPPPTPLPMDLILPTDDWPYLYLHDRRVDGFYFSLIGVLIAVSVAAIGLAAPSLLRNMRDRQSGFDPEMFGFGVAFLLLETKSVTEMNLVWGVTWLTSAVVFGSILIMLLGATVIVQLRSIPWRIAVAGLLLCLMVGYLIPVQLLVGRDAPITLLFSVLFVGLPIFFASVCFAIRFATRPAPDVAFGWNLLGAVAGGLLEFSSMAIGFKALSLLAMVIYLIAFASAYRFPKTTAS